MKHIRELDGIRGLAASGVVLFHAFPYTFPHGWACVDLFFVLSGYLITTIILEQSGRGDFLSTFYLRRIFRIWPVYFLTLGAVLVVDRVARLDAPKDGLLQHLVFLQNTPEYFGRPPAPFLQSFAPSWSVAIEEQFYAIWPLFILALGGRATPTLAAGFLAANLAGRAAWPGAIDLAFTRGDGLAFGCLLAWLIWSSGGEPLPGRRRQLRIAFGVAGLAALAYIGVYAWRFRGCPDPQWPATSFTAFGLAFFALIGLCVLDTGRAYLAPLRWGPLRRVGGVSYALYMFHLPILFYGPPTFRQLGLRWAPGQAAATWALIVALPILSWHLVERPLLRLRDRLTAPRPIAVGPSPIPSRHAAGLGATTSRAS